MMNKKNKICHLVTFGCQMNNHDSERITGVLKANNQVFTDDPTKADIIILNTCSVRKRSELKVYSIVGMFREHKKINPNLIIGVGGCVGKLQGEKLLKRSPGVDFVFGPSNIQKLPSIINTVLKTGKKIVHIKNEIEYSHNIPIERRGDIYAWVTIMEGCDNYCTYCIIPMARGRERSRKLVDIVSEVEKLAANKFKEITLLGQNVNSYGKKLEGEKGFTQLLNQLNSIKGIERIRFLTSNPKDFSNEIIETIAKLDKVCNYIHLPLQSGSNHILKMMNRKYTIEEYLKKLNQARNCIPELTISTDIIVGFPGETETDFLETLSIIKNIQFDMAHFYKYSKREKTKAESLKNQVSEQEKQRRFDLLLKTQKEITVNKNKSLIGKIFIIMVEGQSKNNPDKMTGITGGKKIVHFTSKYKLFPGDMVSVRIQNGRLYGLDGEQI